MRIDQKTIHSHLGKMAAPPNFLNGKDSKKFKAAGLKSQAEKLLYLLSENPFYSPPDYAKLVGTLTASIQGV